MATPIGHVLAGYAVFAASAGHRRQDRWTLLGLCLVMAIAPDFDFLPGILVGQPALYHQTITHSFSVAVVTSATLTLLYNWKQHTRMADWGWFCSAYSSHLVIDLFGVDRRPPFGMPLFWPFSNRAYLAPWELFPGVRHATHTATTTAEWLMNIFQPANLEAIGMEILLLLPVVLLVRYGRKALAWHQSPGAMQKPER